MRGYSLVCPFVLALWSDAEKQLFCIYFIVCVLVIGRKLSALKAVSTHRMRKRWLQDYSCVTGSKPEQEAVSAW